MSAYHITKKDLENADDQFCSQCKTRKTKYLGKIMGQKAVLYKNNCDCSSGIKSFGKTEKQLWEHISTPFWQHAGQKPNKQEQAKLDYMKRHNMTWGDMRKERDAKLATNESAAKAFYEHKQKYGTGNAPEARFTKGS